MSWSTLRSFLPSQAARWGLAALLVACAGSTQVVVELPPAPTYPPAPRGTVTDTYHGVVVPDPYRWLEDNESPATQAWVAAEQALTQSWLSTIPERPQIRDQIERLSTYEWWSAPYLQGSRYFFAYTSGQEELPALYWSKTLESERHLYLDPNTLSSDGTVSVKSTIPSRSGDLVAWAVSDGGSDWATWKIRDLSTGQDLPDVIEWTKFGGVDWVPGDGGFYYARYDTPTDKLQAVNRNRKLFYHQLGTPQAQDVLIYSRPDQPDWSFSTEISEDGRWQLLVTWRASSSENSVAYRSLEDNSPTFTPLFDTFDAQYNFVGNEGETLFFATTRDAPRGRVVKVDLSQPTVLTDVIPEAAETLDSVVMSRRHFIKSSLKDAHAILQVYDLAGTFTEEVPLPGVGDVSGLTSGRDEDEIRLAFTSFTQPTTVLRYSLGSGQVQTWASPKMPFDPSQFVTEQIFYPSKDGTRIPLFLVHARDTIPNGNVPTLLYGYGGFNISLTPGYKADQMFLLQQGGLVAVAGLRGGGEYGEEWHEAGTREKKQNVFDDFIAAGEWLISSGWTRSSRLAIQGGSNGGLLVGACLNQRPDLWGAALPSVGVMDMLRYDQFTIGRSWRDDYGLASEVEMFPVLLAYSPYHNVKPGTHYPPVMVSTADHDDRVVPAHSYKYAAAMQAAQAGQAPVLIRIEARAGHSAGTARTKRIEYGTDHMAFLYRVFGMENLSK